MIIGIDGNEANIENRVGVNVYAYEVIWGLYKKLQTSPQKHSLIIYLKNLPLADLPKETNWFKYRILPARGLWILTKLMPHLWVTSEKPDIFLSLSHYVPPITTMPTVCAIMDLGYLESSGQFKKYDFWQLKYWTAISIFVSKYIIAISESTKKDIVRHYPNAAKKVVVIPLAYDKSVFYRNIPAKNVRLAKIKYDIVNDYILFLSTLKPNKNVEGLVAAFAKVAEHDTNVELVIAGKKGWLYEKIYTEVEKYNLTKKVKFLGFIDEADKPALLAGARVFVSPSFWEGFGLHVLEAMAVGTPVVVSDKGSLGEVVGEAGVIVDPYDAESISNGITKIISMDEVQYDRLVEKVLSQAQKFDWGTTAGMTYKLLTDNV